MSSSASLEMESRRSFERARDCCNLLAVPLHVCHCMPGVDAPSGRVGTISKRRGLKCCCPSVAARATTGGARREPSEQ
eukprot:15442924-Alexandrium_andersonii.AAC.1